MILSRSCAATTLPSDDLGRAGRGRGLMAGCGVRWRQCVVRCICPVLFVGLEVRFGVAEEGGEGGEGRGEGGDGREGGGSGGREGREGGRGGGRGRESEAAAGRGGRGGGGEGGREGALPRTAMHARHPARHGSRCSSRSWRGSFNGLSRLIGGTLSAASAAGSALFHPSERSWLGQLQLETLLPRLARPADTSLEDARSSFQGVILQRRPVLRNSTFSKERRWFRCRCIRPDGEVQLIPRTRLAMRQGKPSHSTSARPSE